MSEAPALGVAEPERQKKRKREETGQEEEYEESQGTDVSAEEKPWYAPMHIEIKIRSFGGDIIARKVHIIDDSMCIDPSLGSIHDLAQAYRRKTAQGKYVDGERVYAFIKCPKDDSGTNTIRCDQLPYEKIRFYVSEQNRVSDDDGKSGEHDGRKEGHPLYCLDVTAWRVNTHGL